MWRRGKLTFVLATAQFLVVVLFTLRAYYGPAADASDGRHSYNAPITTFAHKNQETRRDLSSESIRSSTADTTCLMLVSLVLADCMRFLVLTMGLSLALSTDFSVSGVGQTLLSTVLVLQFSLLFGQLIVDHRIVVDVKRLWSSCNAVLSVGVASRAVHGYFSNLQLVFFVIVACISYEVNLFTTQKFTVCSGLRRHYLFVIFFVLSQIHDMFPSMRVLLFGSVFGVGASVTSGWSATERKIPTGSNIQIILICSSIMELCMWPAVFAGSTTGNKQHRIFVNTILAESAAVVTSYASSSLLNAQNRFDVVRIQSGFTLHS